MPGAAGGPDPVPPGRSTERRRFVIRIDAGGWGATYAADESGRLHQIALGPQGHTTEATTDTFWYPDAYPCWGDSDPFRTAALRVTHHDGTLTTRLRFESTERHPRDDGREGIHTTITCLDELFELGVTHHFLTHPSSGVLETWTEIVNGEQGPVTLPRLRLRLLGHAGWHSGPPHPVRRIGLGRRVALEHPRSGSGSAHPRQPRRGPTAPSARAVPVAGHRRGSPPRARPRATTPRSWASRSNGWETPGSPSTSDLRRIRGRRGC
ncbi:MAG: hypothetical protein M5U19_02055 [Microthrixaceae bacterium]|nr:hypothetical protein [Microthrixaceae bacterium]